MLTTAQAAQRLGCTRRRVLALIHEGQLDAERFGRDWAIDEESVARRQVVQDAQRAWAILAIPPRLWGAWWLADPDEIDSFPCPHCGGRAYSPAGDTKYSHLAACPTCGQTID